LTITAVVTNETTGKSISVSLKPVINLINNQHYSKNLKLPGAKTDKYTVTFTIAPPASNGFLLHTDFKKQFGATGDTMFAAQKFSYKGVNFSSVK
jgi:periplasmic iron binding protein